jgi:hypothetical protein
MTTPGTWLRTFADYIATEPRATNRSVLNTARA